MIGHYSAKIFFKNRPYSEVEVGVAFHSGDAQAVRRARVEPHPEHAQSHRAAFGELLVALESENQPARLREWQRLHGAYRIESAVWAKGDIPEKA